MPRPLEPRALHQRQAKTVFLRCPSAAWTLISTGRIHEFRASPGNAPQVWRTPLPTLAVAYRRRPSRNEYDYRLMLLEAVRREALGAITDEGLAAAGYVGDDAFKRWRRDWTLHTKRPFRPLCTVLVFTVRPIEQGDLAAAGISLLGALYGEYLSDARDRVRTVEVGDGVRVRHPRNPKRKLYGVAARA